MAMVQRREGGGGEGKSRMTFIKTDFFVNFDCRKNKQVLISLPLRGITPIDWDTGCAIFEGTFLAEK